MDKVIIKPFTEIKYKIYGYTLPEVPNHNGYVKVGDTTREVTTRIFEQVGTAGLNPNIIFEREALTSDGKWFRDKDLHKYLELNGIEKKDFNGRADEWFYFNGHIQKAEILTDKFINNDYDEVQIDDRRSNYILRSEQQLAVEKTLDYYMSDNKSREFLWNAKPRFGKTLTTYDFIRNIKAQNILIVTNRPAIANSWFDDFNKFISWQEPGMKFVSNTDSLAGKTMSRDQFNKYAYTTENENISQIVFISLQDLKGAYFAGGPHMKLEWVPKIDWDLLVIDEAHEGIDTTRTDEVFEHLNCKFTLHLSGTPFKALASNKFLENQIFNWSYVDEQEAKGNWDESIGSNPYESLPSLNMFTYQMSAMIQEKAEKGLTIENEKNVDYAFDLHEFFKVKDNGNFEYEDEVIQFLDNLSSGKYPFSSDEYRKELNHTFWLLPRVNSAKAMEKLLKNHPVFKEYKVILAAGDGVTINDNLEDEALNYRKNEKSFDKVKREIVNNKKTITLSVGQLTTGVTIPEWSAVLMLNNIQSPSLYFQAAFRAQNPYEFEKDGKLYRKENAYIFDFSPERTLILYDDFANNLYRSNTKSAKDRKNKIKELLNFFPVIAEDKNGQMYEINATEVLTIPTKNMSIEVVKRGFMSNLLFANISGIFSGDSPFKEILDKIKPEKNKRLGKRREINVTDPLLNDEGEVDIPKEITFGKTNDIFGEKIYRVIKDTVELPLDADSLNTKPVYDMLTNEITDSLEDGFSNFSKEFKLNKGETRKIKDDVKTSVEEVVNKNSDELNNKVKDLTISYEKKLLEAEENENRKVIEDVRKEFEQKKNEAKEDFIENINYEIKETMEAVVQEQIENEEEKKKKTTEEDVRDHLRGFARTIPSFLMAYGDENTRLSNFEENIDNYTFETLTSITKNEFRKLRDGFEYEDGHGEIKDVPGLFNEVVFNASIQEFFNKKNELANYFDDYLEEDIFDYIPPQKTNQIFTPKRIVKLMIDQLEQEDPSIFTNKHITFLDFYSKSGLFITEVIKKLFIGIKHEIPNDNDRLKWIIENQVFAISPSNITYNISKNFIMSTFDSNISSKNILEADLTEVAELEKLKEEVNQLYGDDKMKFDVIIGNPPYQEEVGIKETANGQKSVRNIFHYFQLEADKLAEKYSLLIYPGGRWLHRSGKGLKQFGHNQINDPHLSKVIYFPDASDIFQDVGIYDGISIVFKDYTQKFNSFHYEFIENNFSKSITIQHPGEKILPLNPDDAVIVNKIDSFVEDNNLTYLHDAIYSRQLFGIESNFVEKNPKKVKEYHGENYDQSKWIKLFTNDKAGKAGRSTWFLTTIDNIPRNQDLVYKWKVVVSSANAGGQKRDNQLAIIDNKSAFGRSRLALKSFDTKEEAENFYNYVDSYIIRYAFLMTDENLSSLALSVPDLINYRSNNIINFNENIDEQLIKLIGLTNHEIDHIKQTLNDLR